jgi:hypothetical protein
VKQTAARAATTRAVFFMFNPNVVMTTGFPGAL